MPNFDEDGNLIPDPEEDDPEGAAVEAQSPNYNADIGEYIRRMQAQNQMVSAGSVPPSSYSPTPIGPAETRYRQTQAQTPLKQNFHPSGFRKILGTLSGVAQGVATGDPNAANAQKSAIIDRPYNKAQGDFQQKLGVQAEAAKEEEAATSRASIQELAKRRAEAEVSRRGAEDARGNRYNWMISPEGQKFELDKTRLAHPSTNKPTFHEAKLKDGSLVSLSRDPITGQLKDVDTGTVVHMNAIDTLSDPNKSLKETKEANMPSALAGSIKAREIVANPDKYDQPTQDAAREFITQLESGKPPQAAFGSIVAKRNAERKTSGKPEMSSAELEALETKLLSTPKPPQAPVMIDPSTQKFIQPKPGDIAPPGVVTPQQQGNENMGTATTRTMKETAPKVVALANKVLAQVKQQKDSLGPSASRWSEFWAGKVGAPNPEFTKLRTDAGLLQTLLMRMHVGASGRVALMAHFQDLMDYSKQSPENMEAAVGEIKDYAQEVGGFKPQAPNAPQNTNLPKIGETFEGSKVKSIKQIK